MLSEYSNAYIVAPEKGTKTGPLIDAVYPNLRNIAERPHEVSMMSDMYHNATWKLTWLSNDNENLAAAFALISFQVTWESEVCTTYPFLAKRGLSNYMLPML